MSTKTEHRAEDIMKQLLGHGEASVDELVELTGTSAPSIRRDLIALEGRGLIRRTHGGGGGGGARLWSSRCSMSLFATTYPFRLENKRTKRKNGTSASPPPSWSRKTK